MAGESVVPAQAAVQAPRAQKARLVYAGFGVPFVLLILCFAAWGSAANLTDVLVGVFRHIFTMSNFQSALVQFAYYGAYFSLAIPAALINRRFGYKAGVLTGLGLASVGGLLFIPASNLLAFAPSSSPCSCWPPGCRSSRPRRTLRRSRWGRRRAPPSGSTWPRRSTRSGRTSACCSARC